MSDVIVVGGGMLGLTLALRLRQQGHDVTVLEGASDVGGLAAADGIGDVRWDRFYHVILGQDTRLLALLREIGLGDAMRWGRTRTGFYVDGRWYSMSTALDFLRFPPLGLIGKGRLAMTILAAARQRDPAPLEARTAFDWLTQWSGRATVEAIWGPLLRSKLGANAESASAAFIWAIIKRMYGARQPGLERHEAMGYVRSGYDRVVPALRAFVEAAGVSVATGARVTQVVPDTGHVHVVAADGRTWRGADVLLTVSCPQVSALCPFLTAAEQARLGRVTYQGVICPSFLLRRPLHGFYVTNITDAGLPFTGVIETTALVDPAELGGYHLVYLPRYLTQDDPAWELDDRTIAAQALAGLQRMVPDLHADDVVATRVARARDVLAVSTRHYSRDAMPPVATSHPRVHVVNSAQIAHGTLNVDETVRLAEGAAQALARRLGARPGVVHA
ncbi:MAG: NAD(P)/FAD-dependent oxidoreductase [Gemmatimonadetes bacterium]|nr:NAD(P)/FAD-dependent oxidoreductase [Gemmatimonadota bacterium]